MDPEKASATDIVILRRIPFNTKVGLDAWGREKPQPGFLSLSIPYDFQRAATHDDVSHTLDYGKLYKLLSGFLATEFDSVTRFFQAAKTVLDPLRYFLAEVALPKANLRAEGGLLFCVELKKGEYLEDRGEISLSQSLNIRGIHCACIIGVNPHEREEKQIVVINLDFKKTGQIRAEEISSLHYLEAEANVLDFPYAAVIREVVKVIRHPSFVYDTHLANEDLRIASRMLSIQDRRSSCDCHSKGRHCPVQYTWSLGRS